MIRRDDYAFDLTQELSGLLGVQGFGFSGLGLVVLCMPHEVAEHYIMDVAFLRAQ